MFSIDIDLLQQFRISINTAYDVYMSILMDSVDSNKVVWNITKSFDRELLRKRP